MTRQTEAVIPTPHGNFNMVAFADDNAEKMPHLAMVHEDFDPEKIVTIRMHSECLTGDLFGSKRCDCGEQLERAMDITSRHAGVVLYLRQEGRGIGLINKLNAYQLQDTGLNTIDANTHQGLPAEGREYSMAVAMLKDLGITRVNLLTNNPLKVQALIDSGIEVVNRLPIEIPAKMENRGYLETKRDLMGHLIAV